MSERSHAHASRRLLIVGGSAALLAACGKREKAVGPAPGTPPAKTLRTVDDAIAGRWRSAADKSRDRWRHPRESLVFWGLRPGMTVVEFWPGAGWYTDILGPYLTATGGVLYAANMEPGPRGAPTELMVDGYRAKMAARRDLYGAVKPSTFGAASGPVAPANSADLALFLRNLHNWMAAGTAEKAFREAFAALKPGGVLGVEEHRARPGGIQDGLAASGYVQEAYVRRLAQEAGFRFAAASEINANPKDDRDHPFGVWTLPPTRLTAPRGQPANPRFNRASYDAIGESDRMTLKFVKPK